MSQHKTFKKNTTLCKNCGGTKRQKGVGGLWIECEVCQTPKEKLPLISLNNLNNPGTFGQIALELSKQITPKQPIKQVDLEDDEDINFDGPMLSIAEMREAGNLPQEEVSIKPQRLIFQLPSSNREIKEEVIEVPVKRKGGRPRKVVS